MTNNTTTVPPSDDEPQDDLLRELFPGGMAEARAALERLSREGLIHEALSAMAGMVKLGRRLDWVLECVSADRERRDAEIAEEKLAAAALEREMDDAAAALEDLKATMTQLESQLRPTPLPKPKRRDHLRLVPPDGDPTDDGDGAAG